MNGARALLVLSSLAWSLAPGASSPRADEAAARSVYQLDVPWTDDAGAPLHLRQLAGGVRVLTLIYTSCPGACPATVKALQMLERRVSRPGRAGGTQFVLVTVDPERDTPDVLRRYRRDMHLGKDRWKLMRGSESDVRKLAAVLGFNYEQIDSGEFVHSNLVTVLDARGEIVHQQNGVGSELAALDDAIRRAAIEGSQ